MDELFGAVIFIIFVIVSLANKLREMRRAAEQKRVMEPNRPSAKDLPLATQQQIYGTAKPRTAQPRKAPSAAPRKQPAKPVRQKPKEEINPAAQQLVKSLQSVLPVLVQNFYDGLAGGSLHI